MANLKLTFSSELMTNYLHAELISPQGKFEALQSSNGNSLIFGVGTDGVFNLVSEDSGFTAAGWSRTDLSTAQIARDFPGQSGVICRTFGAGQSVKDGSLGLAMIVENSGGDNLYLCLGNSNKNISWAKSPVWTAYPFDNPNTKLPNLSIVNVSFCEVSESLQYIVVDVLRDPSNPSNDISRFFIDPAKTNGYFWQAHDLPVDIEAATYDTCVGRLPNGFVDGMYTAGKAGSNGQLVFSPMINVFGEGPPTPIRLNLPGGVIPSAIAPTRNADLSTNLFVASGDVIYYFESTNQQDSALGVQLLQNSLFQDISHLYAYSTDTLVFLWGLNRDNQAFYVTCPIAQVMTPTAWSVPLPILSGVDLISPYVNLTNNGNTIFAVGDNMLYKMMRSPTTGVWTTQDITLPAAPSSPAQSFSSYTTTIQITDDNGQPIVNSPLMLSTTGRATFFINNLYYVLDPTPISITSDALGNITLIESLDSLHGTQIVAALQGGTSVQINPMEKPFNKVAALNSVTALKSAMVPGAGGTSTPLIGAGVSDSDLQALVQANQGIASAYATVSKSPMAASRSVRHISASSTSTAMLASFPDAIAAEAGDIFRWLASGVESIITIVEDAVSGIWHFVAKIAGEVYTCVLDTVETIVGAVEWVFNAIKTAIADLIKFLEFLFEWNDILTTHRVMKNVFVQMAQNSIDSLAGYKTDIAAAFQSLINDVNKWADIPNFSQTAANTIAANPPRAGQNSSPANLGVHHFQGNASSAQSSFTVPGVAASIFQDLLTLLQNEGATLSCAYTAIQTDIIAQFDSLSVTQIVQKFVAIVVDTLLETVENILIAALDVFVQLTQGLLDLFTATIDIPVISWLYKEVSGDNLSFLDLVCLISAIPATIIYKAVSGSAPFPSSDPFTQGLLNAQSWDGVKSQFFTSASPAPTPSTILAMKSSDSELTSMSILAIATSKALVSTADPVLNEARLKIFGVVTGFFAFAGSLVLIVTSTIQRTFDVIGLGNPLAKTTALVAAIGNVAYVSPNIASIINGATANWYQQLNNALTGISLVKGFVNIPLATLSNENPASRISPAIESVINVVWNVPVIMNIIENKDRWNTDYKSLIPESIGNFCFNLGGIMEFPIAMTKDAKAKAIESGVQFGLMLVYGICMPVAGGINEWA